MTAPPPPQSHLPRNHTPTRIPPAPRGKDGHMARTLTGMPVLVTGGGSGIGAAVAIRLAQAGARVTLAGRRPDKVAAVAAQAGPNARAVAADVTTDAGRRAMVAAAVEHGGGLEAVVHGAGNMYRGPIEALDEQALHDVFASNTIGPMLLTGLAVPYLRECSGAVVFFG